LPNDPRGSGSSEIRSGALASLGPIHSGRKAVQPARSALRAFHRDAAPLLAHQVLWFDDSARRTIAGRLADLSRRRGWSVYACAILCNHVHLVVGTHRDNSTMMLGCIAAETAEALRGDRFPGDHPVWSDRPYKVYLRTAPEIRSRIRYVENNPVKGGLGVQTFDFVTSFDAA
jgi:REP element-mobilizing transposase RayT